MNLYLLLAIAFGAITGAAEAPVARTTVILSRAGGEGSQVARTEILPLPLRCAQSQSQGDGVGEPIAKRLDSPLTGAATPRAPATIG